MKNIFSSPRFWLIVIIAVLQSLTVFNIINGDQADRLINILSVALGSMVALRTVDKVGEAQVSAAKIAAGTTTISMPKAVSTVTARKTTKK